METLLVGQWNYVYDLLKSNGMTNCKPCNLPMKAGFCLNIDYNEDSDKVDLKVYQSLGRKLMYSVYGTKPDISFIIE